MGLDNKELRTRAKCLAHKALHVPTGPYEFEDESS